jgi:DNA invertase Pin-like site-specific DNA recombinase
MRAALYARVSTHDQQTLGMQIDAIADYISDRGWDAVKQIKDVGSGAKDRPGRELLLKAARRREIDVIVVWRLDRWGRSLPDLVVTLRELIDLGVGFVSLTEALDLTTPTGAAERWRGWWPSSPSSSVRSCASVSAPALPRLEKRADPTAGHRRRH